MPNALILKDDVLNVLEVFEKQLMIDCRLHSASVVHDCWNRVIAIRPIVQEHHAKWIDQHGYTACSNCGTHGYKPWKRCPVCEAKMDLEETC